jgi:PAS domain S-box-containing protein
MMINKPKNILVFVLIGVVLVSAAYMYYAWNTATKAVEEEKMKIAVVSEITLDGEMFKQLRAVPEDVGTVAYESIKKRLASLLTVDASIRFAYIYTQRNGKIYFMADSEPVGSKDYSPPGQEFTEASEEIKRPLEDGKALITKPTTDRWGTWVSVLVPMRDSETGKVRAVFGLDYPAKSWNNDALFHLAQAGIISIITFLLAIAFYLIANSGIRARQAERETKKERDKLDAILHDLGDGVFVVDKEMRVTLVNPKATEISGFSFEECAGREYWDVFNFVFEENGKMNDKFVKRALASGKTQETIYRTLLIKKNGVKIPVSDTVTPLKDEKGKIIGCVIVFRDITKEREVEKMKSEFVSMTSHQLKTPLGEIKWVSELLLGDKKEKHSEREIKFVKDIHLANERMLKLIADLLDVSHIETGKNFVIEKKETDMVKLVDEVLADNNHLAEAKNISIVKCQGAPQKLLLKIDSDKIKHVFNNLISNAIKYSKENGNVSIGCEEKKNEIVFIIKDDGIGIPKAQQSRIFEKFFRADNALAQKAEGTGLGLYIAKAIVEAHKGKIWLESEENKGTAFYFSLPLK